jgi:hypothetical protein
LFGSPLTPGGVVANPASSFTTIPIHVQLAAVVDVSDPAEARLLDTNAQELTGDWRGYRQRGSSTSVKGPTGRAPTQEFGTPVFTTCPDVQGIVTLSARLPYKRILGIFTTRLKLGRDYVSYTANSTTKQIP